MSHIDASPTTLLRLRLPQTNPPIFVSRLVGILTASFAKAGDVLFYQDEVGSDLYFMVTGRVNLFITFYVSSGRFMYTGEFVYYYFVREPNCCMCYTTLSPQNAMGRQPQDQETERWVETVILMLRVMKKLALSGWASDFDTKILYSSMTLSMYMVRISLSLSLCFPRLSSNAF